MESFLSFNSTENFRKKLISRNLKPYKVDKSFNSDGFIREIILQDYAVTDNSDVTEQAKILEPRLIGLNKYTPIGGFGETVVINKNFGSESNTGNYPFQNLKNTSLELIGNQKESFLYTKNIYGPVLFGTTYGSTVDINKDKQVTTNKGNYNFNSSFQSKLEVEGNNKEIELRVLNKYDPETIPIGYGDTVVFETFSLGSNFGEYDYVSDGPNRTTSQSQLQSYLLNKYGPKNQTNGFGLEKEPNIWDQTITNLGEYSFLTSQPNKTIEQSRIEAFVSNKYGPELLPGGYGNTEVDPFIDKINIPNQGQYRFSSSLLPKTNEQQQTAAYIKNIYNTGEGSYEIITIDDLIQETRSLPYLNSDSTFIFIKSDYTPIEILTSDNPQGSDGSLSQDSVLAQLGAKKLKSEYETRIAYNLLKETYGKSNLTNNTIEPNTGTISISPKEDPFLALGVVAGTVPIINKDYSITSPPQALGGAGQSLFEQSLAGVYLPVSPILGEYFDYPQKNFLLQAIDNPVALAAGSIANLATKIITPLIDSSSELFLSYTSAPTKQLLFSQLFYNQYRPQYRADSLLSPNLLAPKSSFYVGTTKNFIRDAVSPKTDIALGKFGKTNDGPVFSYSEIGKEYEGKKISDLLFGFKSRPFYDSVGLQGGFTWMSKNNFFEPGKLVGKEGKKIGQSLLDNPTLSELNKTNSSNQSFTDGSILDMTQKLVDAGNKSTRKLEHVGNAINQISKVFNDGYNELTKGSRVIKYQTPTSKNSQVQDVVGYEYCRLFTKDLPYSKFVNAQKSGGGSRFDNASVTKTLEKVGGTYSILDSPANLNIAPMNGQGSTNFRNGKVKKYMLSIENLAWRTSNRVGYRVEDLPACEIGPNGGRIMWFPPYNVSFDETSRAKFQGHEFIGRTEPIYTYQGAERTGSIGFKMVVDHPSVLNTIVKKELEKVDSQTTTKIVDSFFAGCLKYDPYDLLKKYRSTTLTLGDIFEAQNALTANVTIEQYRDLNGNLPNGNAENTITTNNTTNGNVSSSGTTGTPTNTLTLTAQEEQKFEEITLLFDIDNSFSYSFDYYFSTYITKLSSEQFLNNFSDKVYSYDDTTKILSGNELQNFSLKDYVDARKVSIGFYEGFLKSELTDYREFKTKLLELMKSGAKVSFDIFSYYPKLSEEIIENIKIEGDGEKTLKDYIDNGLTINTVFKVTNSGDNLYRDIDCTKSIPNAVSEGPYTLQGRFCYNAFIRNVKVENNPNSTANQSTTNQGGSEGAYDPNAGEDGRDPNLQQRPSFQTENITTQLPESRLRQKVTKKLLRNLFSECTYFDMIKDSDPFIYDGIKEKIKHFHPVFHSTTPEGLNSRLTFLQQCMLPGDTIPTAVQVGSTTTLAYNDVYNSAFGSPPILVLRVGDFYHTKIVPETLTLKYEDAKFDLNPEGIGVQPMFVDVTLSFKFIGGHGLAEPVAKLNNALSFNFYANTEIYDERAEETFDFTSILDSQLIQDVSDEVGLIKPGTDTDSNDSGNPIGTTENTYFDSNVNTIVGQINYKNKMNDLSDKTKVMVSGIKNQLVELFDWRGDGALRLFTYNRKYKDGYTNYFNNSTKFDVEIFGKPDTYAKTLRDVFEQTKKDIDDGLCPLFGGKPDNIKDNDFRKIKNNLKQILDDELILWTQKFDSAASYLAGQNATDFIQILDQMNFVLNNVDGYKNKTGNYILYNISGTTEVAPPTTTGTTYDELLKDVTRIGIDLNYFFGELEYENIIPNGTNEFKPDYTFEIDDDITLPEEKRFYIIFGKTFYDENKFKEFFNKLINGVSGQNDIRNVKNWLLSQSGYFELNGNFVKNGNTDSLSNIYDQDFLKIRIDRFITESYNPRFENYKPYEKNKIRRFTLSKQINIDQLQLKNFQDLWSTNNLESVYFNLKKKLN